MARSSTGPSKFFSKEPAETFTAPAYVGWLAHLGSVVWSVGATTSVFTAAVLSRTVGLTRRVQLLGAIGALTLLLVADDLFLLHDGVYSNFGIPEEAVYGLYAASMLAIVWRLRDEFLRTDAVVLLLAGASLAVSIGSDFVQETFDRHMHVMEDGAKFVGASLWTAYLVATSARSLLELSRGDIAAS